MYSLHRRGKFTCDSRGKESLPEGKDVKKPSPCEVSSLESPTEKRNHGLSGGGVSRVPIEKMDKALGGGGKSRAHYRGEERSSGAVELPQRSPPPTLSVALSFSGTLSVPSLSVFSLPFGVTRAAISCSQFRISFSLISSIFSPSCVTFPLLTTLKIHIH
jgi:hypothetical protein